jgi:hypothetical protein
VKKINDKTLIEMADSGIEQKEIALHFNVSGAAICKRLKKLRYQKATASALEPLTAKQQAFVTEYCNGSNITQSALKAYDCLPDNANGIGRDLLQNENVKAAIATIMEHSGLTRGHLVRTLKKHVDSDDGQVSLRATVESFKLFNDYPAITTKNLNVNAAVNPVDLSNYSM